jgi:methionyl-tRNA synthetase
MAGAVEKTFYITTPIYYVNDVPHIGHCYTTIACDTLARFQRLRGRKVLFTTGTDENAEKVFRAAQERGIPPMQLVDETSQVFADVFRAMHVRYDRFIRTTEDGHRRVVQKILERLRDNGDLYLAPYEGWYCVPCETFFTDKQLMDGNCPDCGRPVEKVREELHFFRTSKYADAILAHIEAHPEFIRPESRRNEVLAFIQQGLRDACVTRRASGWGIPVPWDESKTIYVWLDALINYLTVTGYLLDGDQPGEMWPPDVQVMGKDILPRFHATIWPAVLLSLGLPLPKMLFGHGWWTTPAGDKISKSKGGAPNPLDAVRLLQELSGAGEAVAVDAVRYFLLREVTFGLDGGFSTDALLARFDADLANDLGNLLNRTLPLVHRYAGGLVPAPVAAASVPSIAVGPHAEAAADAYERLDFSVALSELWGIIGAANKYIDTLAPWNLAKEGNRAELANVIYNVLDCVLSVAVMVSPVMPAASAEVLSQLGVDRAPEEFRWSEVASGGALQPGTAVRQGRPIFPRTQRKSPPAQPKEAAAVKDTISYKDFQRMDLRVAEVLRAQRVEGADKLLQLQVDLGDETRTIVAGIAQQYTPEELVGRRIVVVANLEPANIRGIESKGMLLAAGEEVPLALLTLDRDAPPGTIVR